MNEMKNLMKKQYKGKGKPKPKPMPKPKPKGGCK
jgi:hypothetical protein